MSEEAKEWEADMCEAFRAFFKECAELADQDYDEWVEEAYRGQF